jgi:hypothetical protein
MTKHNQNIPQKRIIVARPEIFKTFFNSFRKIFNKFVLLSLFAIMTKQFIVFSIVLFAFFQLSAQVGMGRWRMHVSPKTGVAVAKKNDAVFIALENGLLEYDFKAGEKTLRTAADFLSSSNLTAIYYHPQGGRLYIGYADGNLDLLRNEQITNINAIAVASITGVKRINAIKSRGNDVHLATGFGIVVINDGKTEVKDTYYPTSGNQEVVDIAFTQDSIYALTPDRLFVGSLSNNFLADPAQWREAAYLPNYSSSGVYTSIEVFNNEVFVVYNDEVFNADTLFQLNRNTYTMEPFMFDAELNSVTHDNNQLLVSGFGGLYVYNADFTQNQIIFQYNHGTFPNAVDAVYADGYYFIADRQSGLVKAANAFNTQQLLFEGPDRARAFRAQWQNGKLVVAGGSNDRAGYTLQDESWTSVNISEQQLLQNAAIPGFISCAVNRRNVDEFAFGSFSEIPLAIVKNGVSVTDTFSIHNSLLEIPSSNPANFNSIRITDLMYDGRSNLWMLNSSCERPLKVRTEAGTWHDFDLGSAARNRETRRLRIDNFGVKWIAIEGAGIFAYDDNETLGDVSDDRLRLMNTGENSGALPTTAIEALAVDLDNNIWVGTTEGMRVLYNSRNVFTASPGQYNFQRLLIEFGENVEIVLGTTHITAIEVDGANRKWIGTANAGVFLFSPDGLTMIENFTQQNSPLLSNAILDITIDHKTGEVFFVTDRGMISYRADASRGDNNYSEVKVFPNPVYQNYFGPITIQGIAANSEVRITDIAGNLVYRTASNGGTATWDGNTVNGQRVATGVYLIWTSVNREDTKGRHVGKVLVIN